MAEWEGGGGSSGPTKSDGANEWNGNGTTGADEWNDGGGATGADDFNAPGGSFDDHEGAGGAGGDRACFNCGEEGHQKADCTKPRVMKCRHCNEEGHLIRNCPTAPPQEFTGECRHCHKEGHMAKDCPEKPPMVCNNCREEGHMAATCNNARMIDRSRFREVTAEAAWKKITEAAKTKDMEDVKEGVQEYVKSVPNTTYPSLEEAFRAQGVAVYLVALENPSLMSTHTHMDLQGNLGKKYRVHYRFTDKPLRPRENRMWPKSHEENLQRLLDAGETVDRGLPKCSNCGELGHISKRCSQEKTEKEHLAITCFNCEQPGHRVRDCPEPRKSRFACKNCGKEGHVVADCTEPRQAPADLECRKCGGAGHFAKDCPQGGGGSRACYNCGEEGHNSKDCTNPKKVQCRNCDAFGHMSKECPKPRDYSRVKCSRCGDMGHTQVRCKMEAAPVDGAAADKPARGQSTRDAAASGDWETNAANSGPADWETNAANSGPADWETNAATSAQASWEAEPVVIPANADTYW